MMGMGGVAGAGSAGGTDPAVMPDGVPGSAIVSDGAAASGARSEVVVSSVSSAGGSGKSSPLMTWGSAGSSSLLATGGGVFAAGGGVLTTGAGMPGPAGAATVPGGEFLIVLMRTTTPAASMYCVRGCWLIDSATAGAGVGAVCSGPKSSAIWVSRLLILRFRLKNRSCIDLLGGRSMDLGLRTECPSC